MPHTGLSLKRPVRPHKGVRTALPPPVAVSRVDHLTSVVGLQSRVIAGVSFEQLLSELGSYRELNSLATLAEQLGRTGIAAEARAKAIEVATHGGAEQEIDLLSSCLRNLGDAEINYLARWRNDVGADWQGCRGMSARTRGFLRRVAAVEKAVSRRCNGDSIEECGRYFRALDGPEKQDYLIIATDEEIAAHAIKQGMSLRR